MEPKIIVEKVAQLVISVPAMPTMPSTFRVLITETRKDEVGNEYEYTRVERVSADMLQAQKDFLQKQISAIDEKLAAIENSK